LTDSESFLYALWQARQQSRIPELQDLFHDIVSCLEAVNYGVNTQQPSDTMAGKAQALPRSLIADASYILSSGWRDYWRWSSNLQLSESFRTELAAMLVQIGIAWDAVLAGDIDDIRAHIRTELVA
jgi:hypothetical protein